MKMGYEQHLTDHIPYGRARGQHEVVNGKSVYLKSQVEVRFLTIGQRLQQTGAVLEVEYEPKTFWFDDIRRGTCSYTPDFRFLWADNEEEVYYETKSTNGLRQKDVTKYRRMAKRYPEVKLVLVLPREPRGSSKSAIRQRILLDNASKYVHHVTYLTDWRI
jgi:hypothetical protein